MSKQRIDGDEAAKRLRRGELPDGAVVTGTLDLAAGRGAVVRLPEGLDVEVLRLDDRADVAGILPERMSVYELSLRSTDVTRLPAGLDVRQRLDLTGCTMLESLPEGLDVWFLDLAGCWALEGWPESVRVRGGTLSLPGCVALAGLPEGLGRLSGLDVRECPQLTSLPGGLTVTGWIDLAHSGLTTEASVPESAGPAELRWGGVPIDRRVAFHPDTITPDEVIAEANAERRRVLIDRYGYGRLLRDLDAKVLDADRDPGGERQLLRVPFENDEDLVALSCHCPSTGRQYVIRVPPKTPTCHAAAAWIAGFDDPDDYRPLAET